VTVREDRRVRSGSLAPPGLLLGVGLGGLFDGIVLHQILQWHHLVSTPTPPTDLRALEVNTLADGLFHILAWVVVVVGLSILRGSADVLTSPGGGRQMAGAVLVGWGSFNLVEGVVDHHLLNLHHVRPGPDQLVYDLGFLAWGAVMVAIGVALYRSGKREVAGATSP
jgi:uncharacterized membrane protein